MNLSRSIWGTVFVFGLMGAMLFAARREDYPALHTVLDTGIFLLSAMVAWAFWELNSLGRQPLARHLAAAFTVAAGLNFIHMVVHLEWSGPLLAMVQSVPDLKSSSWSPSVHVLPLGVGYAVFWGQSDRRRAWWLASGLLILGLALVYLFNWLPHYSAPLWFGITRPALLGVPLLWAAIAWLCWGRRAQDRLLPPLACMAVVLMLANTAMLYSRAPQDTASMVAHLGRVCGFSVVLLSLLQLAMSDMRERQRAEKKLAELNLELERRVQERTRELGDVNRSLAAEMAARRTTAQENARLAAIVQSSDDAIISKTPDGVITSWNGGAEKLFGYSTSEAVGQSILMLFPPERRTEETEIMERILQGRNVDHFETERLRRDGTRVAVSVSISPLRDEQGRVVGASKIARDITARKRAEEAMHASEARYRALFDSLIEGFCTIEMIFDSEGRPVDYRFLEVNPAFERQTGLRNAPGKSIRELAPGHEAHWLEIYGHIATSGEPMQFENESKSLGRFFDVCAYRVGGPGSRKVAILWNDITQRKRAEARLREQLERLSLLHHITRAIGERQDLRSIFQVVVGSLEDDLPVDFSCICRYDRVTESLTVACIGRKGSPLAAELGLAEDGSIPIDQNGLSRCLRGELVYEPDVAQVNFPFPQRLAQGGLRSLVVAPLAVESEVFGVLVAARREPQGFVSGECEFLRQLSEHTALASHQSQLYGVLQAAYDDLQQTQQAVLQQERLRALGQMASGIAHDINNALSPVSLYTEVMLEKEQNLSPQGRGYLEIIAHAIDDVAQTVARMREFYRQREPELSLAKLDLNQMVQQVVALSRARWYDMPQRRGIDIHVATDLQPDLPLIMGAESEIREALINLIFNAVDAMPVGGTLTLRTREIKETAADGTVQPHQVAVEVSDTGVGMDEDTRRRCLEPFFTTKGERGTGLGLAMVYGMVKRHSADLDIDSTVGQGTTMRLTFAVPAEPLTDQAVPAVLPPAAAPMRILVVDDDPLLIRSLRDALEADGHHVVAADGGQAGLDAFREALNRHEPFGLVITDLGMPHVDGRKVASGVKMTSPRTPIIMLTGWGQWLAGAKDASLHVDRVLSKPPRRQELRAALMELTLQSRKT